MAPETRQQTLGKPAWHLGQHATVHPWNSFGAPGLPRNAVKTCQSGTCRHPPAPPPPASTLSPASGKANKAKEQGRLKASSKCGFVSTALQAWKIRTRMAEAGAGCRGLLACACHPGACLSQFTQGAPYLCPCLHGRGGEACAGCGATIGNDRSRGRLGDTPAVEHTAVRLKTRNTHCTRARAAVRQAGATDIGAQALACGHRGCINHKLKWHFPALPPTHTTDHHNSLK